MGTEKRSEGLVEEASSGALGMEAVALKVLGSTVKTQGRAASLRWLSPTWLTLDAKTAGTAASPICTKKGVSPGLRWTRSTSALVPLAFAHFTSVFLVSMTSQLRNSLRTGSTLSDVLPETFMLSFAASFPEEGAVN